MNEGSREQGDDLWREVLTITLDDPYLFEAVAKGGKALEMDDDSISTDREMEVGPFLRVSHTSSGSPDSTH